MTVPAAALRYGLGAFVIGFALGVLRETVLIPALGARLGAWAEFPAVTLLVMLLGLAIGRRLSGPGRRLACGLGAVAVLLVCEAVLAFGALGMTPDEWLARLDPRSGGLFPLGLALMVAAPVLATRR